MRFILAAFMAIVALSDTTDAKRYPKINGGQEFSDCTKIKFSIISYAGKNCTGAKKVKKHF